MTETLLRNSKIPDSTALGIWGVLRTALPSFRFPRLLYISNKVDDSRNLGECGQSQQVKGNSIVQIQTF